MTQQELITKDEMPPEVLAAPAVQAKITSNEVTISRANSLQVSTADDYRRGSELVQRMMGAIKELEEDRLSTTRLLDATKKRIMNWFAGPIGHLEEAQKQLRAKLIAYDTEQKKIAEAARKKAEEEERARVEAAERVAAEERRKIREAEENAAKEAELRRQAEEKAKREAEAARKSGDEAAAKEAEDQARRERMARIRADNQREAELEEARERARAADAEAARRVAPPPTQEPVKVAGQARRQIAKYKITDPTKINAAFMVPDEKAIGAYVRAKGKAATTAIGAGIEVWLEDDLSFRAK